MIDSQMVLHGNFDIETHKKTFINYLEVIITEDGTIVYAVPSHQEKLISIAMKKLSITREELGKLCPPEYYFDYMYWLCKQTNCISVWNTQILGNPNEEQRKALETLSKERLYYGIIK